VSADGLRRESVLIESIGDWLDRRRRHITASRMAALFDAHLYMNREQLAEDLRGQSVKGDTPAMARGRRLEVAVIEALRETHPDWTIERCRSYFWVEGHRLGATPDALFAADGIDDGLIEAKTVHPRRWDEWHGRPPISYVLQTLTGLLVTGRTRGVLACMVLSGDFPVYEFEVPRHPEAEQRILEATAAWWQEYDAGRIAAPQPVDELEALLDTGEHLDWSGNHEIAALLDERVEAGAALSDARQRLGHIDHQIKTRFGTASTAWCDGWSLSFRRHLRRGYTVPEGYVRTLRIKKIGEEPLDE
jgi:predicted phage-related endonuclease